MLCIFFRLTSKVFVALCLPVTAIHPYMGKNWAPGHRGDRGKPYWGAVCKTFGKRGAKNHCWSNTSTSVPGYSYGWLVASHFDSRPDRRLHSFWMLRSDQRPQFLNSFHLFWGEGVVKDLLEKDLDIVSIHSNQRRVVSSENVFTGCLHAWQKTSMCQAHIRGKKRLAPCPHGARQPWPQVRAWGREMVGRGRWRLCAQMPVETSKFLETWWAIYRWCVSWDEMVLIALFSQIPKKGNCF